MPNDPVQDLRRLTDVDTLNERFADDPGGAIRFSVSGAMGQVALVSSFGAEAAVLLHMVAQVDHSVPIIFIDTLMLFPETIAYHEALVSEFGFVNVRRIEPDRVDLFLHDPDALLHRGNPDACCDLRKARTLTRALQNFDGWISGRKRFQSGQRAGLEMFERDPVSGVIKINPLAIYGQEDLRNYMAQHGLPHHPLVSRGYPSIGCMPCTTPSAAGEDQRAGRWRGYAKTECGIHIVDGNVVRKAGAT